MIEKTYETALKNRDLSKVKYAILFEEPSLYLLISWLALAGTETYYRNITGEPGTFYLFGFFSLVMGVVIAQFLFRRIKNTKLLGKKLIRQEGGLKVTVRLDDTGLTISREGMDSVTYLWNILVDSQVDKKGRYIDLWFGGTKVTLQRNNVGQDAIDFIKGKIQLTKE